MSSHGRNIFSVLAEHVFNHVSDTEKAQDSQLNRVISLLRDGKDDDIEFLLQESSDELIGKKDTNGWSLLHHAAKQGRAEATELLLESGAYANARDKEENTPLHIACLSLAAAVAHRLVLYGADVEVRNKEGKTPLQLSEKCRTTHAVVLTRVLCNPCSALPFPSRLKFMETFKAFLSARCNAGYNDVYGQRVCDNVDDFYGLFCVVRSHGGNNKCNVGKKWEDVNTELMISSSASGSYQVTYQMYLQRYEVYYNKIIKRLDGKRRKLTQNKCDMEEKLVSNGRIQSCKKLKACAESDAVRVHSVSRKKQRVESLKNNGRATLFDMFALNLGCVTSGYSSSLQVFDQNSFERLQLSVAGPGKSKERCVAAETTGLCSMTHEYEYPREKQFPSALSRYSTDRTCAKDSSEEVEGGACVEKSAAQRRNGSCNGHILPLNNGYYNDSSCVLAHCSPSVYSNGFANEHIDDDTFRRLCMWGNVGSRIGNQSVNGSTSLDKCCNGDSRNDDIWLDFSCRRKLQPFLSPNLQKDFEKGHNCGNGNADKPLCHEKRSVAENDGTVERNRKGKEVVMLDSDNEGTEQNIQGTFTISTDDVSSDSSMDVSSMNSCSLEEMSEGKNDVQKRLQGMVPRRGAGECLLHAAARCGDVEAVQCLLDRGIPVNVKDHAGWTPLHEAVRERQVAVAEFLLQRGAEVNTGSTDGTRPLHDAAESNDVAAVQLLLEHGAVATAENYSGETPYTLTSSSQVRRLLQGYFSSPTGSPDIGQASSHTTDRQLSDIVDDGGSELPALLISGQFSYGPTFEMWERPPPPLFCVSLYAMQPNRRHSCLLFSDLLKYLGMDETSFACSYPEIELVPVEVGFFRSQLSGLLLSHCGVSALCQGSSDTEVILVQYSNRVREILGVDVQFWVV